MNRFVYTIKVGNKREEGVWTEFRRNVTRDMTINYAILEALELWIAENKKRR